MADTQETLFCPACNSAMKKIYLPEQGINIDICMDGCGGMYFDNRELQKVQEDEASVNTILESIKIKSFKEVDGDAPRVCPACGTNMVKMGGSVGIEIDACNVCGGKFLDNGELKKMTEFVSKGDSKFSQALDSIYPQNTKLNARHNFFVNWFTEQFLR